MCEEQVNSMLKLSKIAILTIEYLNNNRDEMIKSLSQILFEDSTNISLSELKNKDNQLQFIENIQEHFQWILDHSQYGTSDFSDYRDDEFVDDEYKIFYSNAIKYIENIDLADEVKNNLINYFKHIKSLQ